MPVMDEFSKEREEMKNKPFKERAAYFWEYYKWWVIGGLVVVIALFITIRQIVTRKDDVMYVAMINYTESADASVDDTITNPFLESIGISTKDYTIEFNTDITMGVSASSSTTYTGEELFAIYVTAGSVDAAIAPDTYFNKYEYQQGMYTPLSDYLSEEQLEKYADKFYYIDMAVVDRYKSADKELNYDYEEDFPTSNDPSKMENPVAVGLIVNDCDYISECFLPLNETDYYVLGLVSNSSNKATVIKFIDYLFG